MAALLDCFSLLGLLNDSDFVGLEQHFNEECVVVSLKKRGISVYKVRDQKPLNSWSLKQSQNLSCPTVVNHNTSQFVAVLNSRHIYTWNEDESNLENSKKIHVDQDIYRVLSIPGVEPVVLFKNGALQFLSHVKESRLNGCQLDEGDEIVWCGSALIENKLCVIITSTQKSTALWLSSESFQVISTIQLPHRELKLISSCIQSSQSSVKLYTLWSDGLLRCSSLTPSGGHVTSDLHNISLLCDDVAAVSCSKTHLALCGVKKHGDATEGVGIWDTKFGTLQAWTPLTSNISLTRKIFCVGNNLFIPHKTSLQVYPYNTKPSTLGAVLGSVKTAQIEKESDTGYGLFKQLITTSKTPNKTKFHSAFTKFVNTAKTIEGQHLLESTYITQIVDRCLNEESFWPRDELEQLIKTSCIPTGCCKNIVNTAVSHKDIAIVQAVLQHVPDVSEAIMVQALLFFLGVEDSACTKALNQLKDKTGLQPLDVTDTEVKCSFSLAKCYFINQVLVLPYNDVFLLESLRKVSFNSVLTILNYLHYLLSSLSAVLTNHKTSTWPSLLSVVDWTSLICDAHMTQLILSPDAREVLLELHSIVMSQMQFYDELVSLEGILSQLKERCAVTQKQNPGLYNIHVLHIQ